MLRDRTLDTLDRMLTEGIAGTFSEEHFDESKLSRLESKWKQYLAAQTLTEQKLEAERAALQALVTDIAHQTKTPMTNVKMYAELLRERLGGASGAAADPEALRLADEIVRQSERMAFLIDALAKLSRLETGILAPQAREEAVAPLIEAAAVMAQGKAGAKGMQIMAGPVDDALTARFDPKWTAEALQNLLDNAVKYAPAGTEVRLNVQPQEMYVRIDVADQGPGVPEKERAQIFTRFYRGGNARGAEGVGVGLTLARGIIEREGGYIRVADGADEEGDKRGAVFSIFLKRV